MPVNEPFGWICIMLGFIAGAIIGTGFHRENFLGGYTSLRRRMIRLGHIALIALGFLNILFAYSTTFHDYLNQWQTTASWALIIGTIAMPACCFLTAWKQSFRHLFFIPVLSLIVGVLSILLGVFFL